MAEEVDLKNLPPATKVQVDFYRDIEPLLKEKCQSCHGAEQQLSGLRLDSRSAALTGGNSGVVVKPGNSRESRLIHLVAGLNKELRMPMTGDPLTTEQVGLLRGWIDQGVLWPEDVLNSRLRPSLTVRRAGTGPSSLRSARSSPKSRTPPGFEIPSIASSWPALKRRSITPSAEADRETLIRRLSLDLDRAAALAGPSRRIPGRQTSGCL